MITYRKIYIVTLLLLFAGAGWAQQSFRLTDHWEFLRQDLGSAWEAVRPANVSNVPIWQAVHLPHCVNATDAVDPDGNYYRGPAWYRTQLTIANPYANGRTLLHFEGAGQKTEVYIFTTRVGSHTGGYDEWTVDITDAVAAFMQTPAYQQQFKGHIPLSIRTDNSRDPEMIPSGLSDFNVYGGLYRYLNLVYTPALSIDKVFANAEPDPTGKSGTLKIKALLYDPSGRGGAEFNIKLYAPDGKLLQETTPAAKTLSDTFVLPALTLRAPQLWSPDHPALYTVAVTVKDASGNTCTKKVCVGFRTFSFVDNGPFLLNGNRLLLRGTHRHEDHAGLGAAMTEDLMRREMILMKEMGVNFIRLAHYQQSPIILHLCDSLGILVWEEIPWCRGGLGGPVYKEQARRMLTNMISQHYDHPAVIIWGLGNENDWPGDFPEFDKAKIHDFMQELNGIAHRLDPSRKTAIRRCDFCADVPDVYSPSIWAGWYRGTYTDYKQFSETEFKKVKHFLHVEWGGDSHAGRHSESPDKGEWSETYICDLIDWHLKEQETMPWLTGSAQWTFKDFSTPSRPDNPVPYVNQKGVVERDLTKKEAYFVFQSYWTTQPMAHIYGHSWPIRWGGEDSERLVKVYSNCDEATLFLNGVSCGLRHRNSQDFPAAGLHWKVAFRKGENSLRVIARKGKVTVEDSLHLTWQTEQWGKPAQVKVERTSLLQDTATVHVQLLDEKGIPCLDAADWVRFGLTGDGQLIDDLGTSTGSRLVQAFNGQAMIRVILHGGASVISVKAGTLPVTFLTLQDSHASAGGRHDFYSEGDYWWPDPKSPDSPYIQRDGRSNPANFTAHRLLPVRHPLIWVDH